MNVIAFGKCRSAPLVSAREISKQVWEEGDLYLAKTGNDSFHKIYKLLTADYCRGEK